MATGAGVLSVSPVSDLESSERILATWRPSTPSCARRGCSLCNGTGWQLVSSGKVDCARRCSCRLLQRLLELRERVRVPRRYEACTLDNYEPASPSQSRALEEARRFADRYPNVPRGLLITGPSGVGKTHLAVGIVRELLDRFEDVVFYDLPALMRSGLLSRGSALEKLAASPRIATVSLLILDGLGAPPLAPDARARMAALLTRRLQAKLPTIVTASGRSARAAAARSRADTSVFARAVPAGVQRRARGAAFRPGALEALIARFRRVAISYENPAPIGGETTALF